MIPIPKRPTVEIFYEMFSKQEYTPKSFYCVPSEFKSSYDAQKKSFNYEEKLIQQEKDFVLTTLKQIGALAKNRT